MFAIPALIGLLVFVYVRPQEFLPALQRVPFLYLFVLLTAVGFVLDVRTRATQLRASPLLPWAAAYFAWSVFGLLVVSPAGTMGEIVPLFMAFFLFLMASQALQTSRALRAVTTTLLVLSLGLAGVGVHQAFAPKGCVQQDDMDPQKWTHDGRSCTDRMECVEGSLDRRTEIYHCEHIGLAETSSVEGRV